MNRHDSVLPPPNDWIISLTYFVEQMRKELPQKMQNQNSNLKVHKGSFWGCTVASRWRQDLVLIASVEEESWGWVEETNSCVRAFCFCFAYLKLFNTNSFNSVVNYLLVSICKALWSFCFLLTNHKLWVVTLLKVKAFTLLVTLFLHKYVLH